MTGTADILDFTVPPIVPLLTLKSTVLFPLQVASVQLATNPNLRLLDEHSDPSEILAAGVYKDPDGPYARRNIGPVAVACRVLSRVDIGGGSTQTVLQGLKRLRVVKMTTWRPYFRAEVAEFQETEDDLAKERLSEVLELARTLVRFDGRYPDELIKIVELNLGNPARCADLIADTIQFGYSEKRRLLQGRDVTRRLDLLAKLLRREVARSRVTREVRTKTEISIDRTQREVFLREQLEVIRRELEELDPAEAEVAELAGRIDKAPLPPLVAEEARREIAKLGAPGARELEGFSIRSYVDWVLGVPWDRTTKDRLDLRRARRMLDERYFRLGVARDRLLEFFAVRKLGGHRRWPLLAILGPPGTGRTSLARTVAEILGRKFVRLSAHEILDRSEIHGSARSEPAARPGRILEGVHDVGARNPVVLIDEIDRFGPKAEDLVPAILEALDPGRNRQFRDHYLGAPFDLSEALFVITASVDEDVPEALQPFLYTVQLSGYTDGIKQSIARKHIWPEVLEAYGLEGLKIELTNGALRRIIREYTREAGVRELKEQLEAVCRRVAFRVTSRGRRPVTIGERNLHNFLGKPIYRVNSTERTSKVGAATGLAWTESGGDLLPIEALLMPGEGFIMLTGLLGEVMEESVEAALSYVRSRGHELGIPPEILREKDLHIHFPEGAIPKDGPSAGIAVATAIASLLSGRPVHHDVAMTGEISLQGLVLPVGGIREKMMAAYRAGITRVLLPRGNESDLAEVPREVRGKLRTRLVSDVSEVFRIALEGKGGAKAAKRR